MSAVLTPGLCLMEKPTHEEAPGANLFIARTAVGEELVTAAIADGAIEVETFTIDELDLQHAERIERKLENPARVRALEIEGELSPSFTGFSSLTYGRNGGSGAGQTGRRGYTTAYPQIRQPRTFKLMSGKCGEILDYWMSPCIRFNK